MLSKPKATVETQVEIVTTDASIETEPVLSCDSAVQNVSELNDQTTQMEVSVMDVGIETDTASTTELAIQNVCCHSTKETQTLEGEWNIYVMVSWLDSMCPL